MPIKTLRPNTDPATLTAPQKEALFHAYVFGTGRPQLLSPLELEKLVKTLDPSGSFVAMAQAMKLHKEGRTAEAVATLKKIKIGTAQNQQAFVKHAEALMALRKA